MDDYVFLSESEKKEFKIKVDFLVLACDNTNPLIFHSLKIMTGSRDFLKNWKHFYDSFTLTG